LYNFKIQPPPLPLQYIYQRPELLGSYSESEFTQFASHALRPVVEPKKEKEYRIAQIKEPTAINSRYPASINKPLGCDENATSETAKSSSCLALKVLPCGIFYAEAMNAGKSRYNEDQATCVLGNINIPPKSKINNNIKLSYLGETNRCLMRPIKYVYVGLFDGHGGPGAAIKASKELHQIVHEGLEDVVEYLLQCEDEYCDTNMIKDDRTSILEDDYFEADDEDETKERKMSRDELVKGAIESAFWAMDRLILRDKQNYRISGGSCVMVALFIFDKLYLANAGDARSCCYIPKEPMLRVMSYDFTPETDRQRIQWVAYQRPDVLRHPVTREKIYNRHVLSRKVTREDVGNSVMYRDFYMSGWSARDVTLDDVRLEPMIQGRGKLCRLMGTMGVARGIGDHGLMVKSSSVSCKEFLTCQPEIRVLDIKKECGKNLTGEEYLIMGTDGLWDVMKNSQVHKLVKETLSMPKSKEVEDEPDDIGQIIARKLVLASRGDRLPDTYWEKKNGDFASGDDISVLVISLKEIMSLTNGCVPYKNGNEPLELPILT